MTSTKSDARDWSATLFLPQTDFPMRAGLPELEPQAARALGEIDLYERLREAGQGPAKFVLHDGPPYANGNIHIGHALNKILKDLVTRSRSRCWASIPTTCRAGTATACRSSGRSRRSTAPRARTRTTVPVNEFRQQCRDFAEHWIDVQREEFKRLGVVGDWEHPYSTMAYKAEAHHRRAS